MKFNAVASTLLLSVASVCAQVPLLTTLPSDFGSLATNRPFEHVQKVILCSLSSSLYLPADTYTG